MKSAQTMMAMSESMGISKLCEVLASANEIGQMQPVVLFDLQGKGDVQQRSISADKHFGLLLVHQK